LGGTQSAAVALSGGPSALPARTQRRSLFPHPGDARARHVRLPARRCRSHFARCSHGLYYSIRARRLLDPLFQGLRNIPSIAWVPLFILWLGIAEASKIALIAVGVFFPVYLNLMSGIARTDRKLVEVGRAYRMTGWRLVVAVLVPAALPAYVVGLRGGLGLGWMFVAAAELMGASEGLGFLLIDGQMTGRPALMIAALITFAVVGKTTDLGLMLLGRRVLRWQDTVEAQAGA
jgi:sulfonate transport system permease protein